MNNRESPKTPGGISKSLLTPCRRVGLSRKWKKGGCSPFVSPLSTQNSTPDKKEDRELKKRKKCDESEILQESQEHLFVSECNVGTPQSNGISIRNDDITTTPCRNTKVPRKKSKTLSNAINSQDEKKEDSIKHQSIKSVQIEKQVFKEQILSGSHNQLHNLETKEENISKLIKQSSVEIISIPVRTESKSKIKLSLKRCASKSNGTNEDKHESSNEKQKPKEKSPNNLTKECIVVIQNKILKLNDHTIQGPETVKLSEDSDSESDVPLSLMTKESTDNIVCEDNSTHRHSKGNPKKRLIDLSLKKPIRTNNNLVDSSQATQSSQESIDKRTILIKKSYNKVTKPSKAKSTGSITQKDIDELRERIEIKKKLLMAKAMSIDTEELRNLIKKWQKGCQDALMELLDLMKRKLPDRQNMDYAEILETLKIPPELVGYDSENDCFVSPEDTNILLTTFKL